MTEAEWLAAADPKPMLAFLGDRASARKRRLFACACCRRHWHWVEGTASAKAVEVAERFADGHATEKKLAAAERGAGADAHRFYSEFRQTRGANPFIAHMHASACGDAALPPADRRRELGVNAAVWSAHTYACEVTGQAEETGGDWGDHLRAESAVQAAVLRDVVGNPFRPTRFLPAWQTADVRLLAEGIYNQRAFDRAPILADALQDAGCDAAELLAHLRDPALLTWEHPADADGPPPACHARGCWALDLVLGFE